jgi:hypothetical protein
MPPPADDLDLGARPVPGLDPEVELDDWTGMAMDVDDIVSRSAGRGPD